MRLRFILYFIGFTYINIQPLNENVLSRFIYFDFFGANFKHNFKHDWHRAFYKDIENIKNDIAIPLFCEPYTLDNGELSKIKNNSLLISKYTYIFHILNNNNFLKEIFNPTEIKLTLDFTYFTNALNILSSKDKIINPILDFDDAKGYRIYTPNKTKKSILSKKRFKDFEDLINISISNQDLDKLIEFYLLFEILLNAKAIRNEDIVYYANYFLDDTIEINNLFQMIRFSITNKDNTFISEYRDSDLKLLEVESLLKLDRFIEDYPILNNKFDKKLNREEFNSIIHLLPKFITIEFFEKEKTILSLSSGEKSYFNFIVTTFFHIYLENLDIETGKIYLFLDEVELGEHPQWQKKLIQNIINIFNQNYELQINLIFATHSPFILSDLPKENVIFLEKYTKKEIEKNNLDQEVGNCKNSTVDIAMKPFGANIHTLLSHGFFMQDGLMGEFAKNKINEIIDFLNDKKTIEEISTPQSQIKKVIESIGEDLLRIKLTDMYFQKFTQEELEQEKLKLLELQSDIDKQLQAIEKKQNDTN